MPNLPEKLFDLMDVEVEPTDEQISRLMAFVGEEVRRKEALQGKLTPTQIQEAADRLVERLTHGH